MIVIFIPVNFLSGLTNWFNIRGSSNATSWALIAISPVISPSGTKSLIIMSSPSALVHWKLVIESTLLEDGVCHNFFVNSLSIDKLSGSKIFLF